MHRNVIGLTALDFILRIVLARVMGMSLVVDVFDMHFDDRAADMAGLRVPRYLITNFEALRHLEPVGAV